MYPALKEEEQNFVINQSNYSLMDKNICIILLEVEVKEFQKT